jgi:TPP-dependent pyruvate/acetoin dehydrogenase alpha subunit
VLRLAKELVGQGDDARQRAIGLDQAVRTRIDAAVKFALESPLPSPATALDHVFA